MTNTLEPGGSTVRLHVGEVLSTTLRTMVDLAGPLTALTAAAVAPFVLLDILSLHMNPIPAVNIAAAVVNSWYFGAVTLLTHGALTGRRQPLSQLAKEAVNKLGAVFAVNFLSGVMIGLGALFFVIPGLIAWATYFVVVPVKVLEDTTVGQALGRSAALTRGHRGNLVVLGVVFAILFVILLATSLGPAVVVETSDDPALLEIWSSTSVLTLVFALSGLVQAAYQAFATVMSVVVYVRLHPSAGKVDADEIAEAFT